MNSSEYIFNIRVYGVLINKNKEVLLADEYQFNQYMTKFPGGGLKYGEGPAECIKREALEEFGQEIEIIDHFYTTDFFQETLFFKNQQLISIYYLIKLKEKTTRFIITSKKYDFKKLKNGKISFRWEKIEKINEDDVTFPVDKHVVNLLKKKYIC